MSQEPEILQQPAPVAVEQLGRALLALAPAFRTAYWEQRLQGAQALPLVRVLACAQRESVRGVLEARVVIDSFAQAVVDGGIDGGLRGALMAGCVLLQEPAVMPLVEAAAQNDSGGKRSDRAKKGSLAFAGETLGRRKWLARSATGDLLTKILDDIHADVIQTALANPKAIEMHAVRVAARRPIAPELLDVVAKSRFGTRHMVRRAILLNPDCPVKLACRIAATMTPGDLQDVLTGQGITPQVREAVRLLLDQGRS